MILKKNDDEFQRIHASKLIDHLSAILYYKANDFHQTDNEIFISLKAQDHTARFEEDLDLEDERFIMQEEERRKFIKK